MNDTIQKTLDLILAGQAKLEAGQASFEVDNHQTKRYETLGFACRSPFL